MCIDPSWYMGALNLLTLYYFLDFVRLAPANRIAIYYAFSRFFLVTPTLLLCTMAVLKFLSLLLTSR